MHTTECWQALLHMQAQSTQIMKRIFYSSKLTSKGSIAQLTMLELPDNWEWTGHCTVAEHSR